jgi:osmotically-inducible protein OsmY
MKVGALVTGLLLLSGTSVSAADPENTGTNVRDKDGGSLTVFDQGGSEADREITAAIRKSIVGDDKLSTNAHNVKIITVDGIVTLRGPVDSAAEKNIVEARAKSAGGVKRVDSHLEVDAD